MREMKDSGIEWIGEIPSSWETTHFRAYVIERNERNKLNKTDELLALSYALGVTLYKDKVYNKDRVKNNFEEYNIVHKNDLVLSPNDIIKGSIFVSQYYGCISPMYNIFAPRNEKTHNLYYLSYLLRTKEAGLRFFYIARGLIGSILDNGKYVTRRMTVSHQDLLSFKVLLPPCEEQAKIVSFLDAKCSEIDALSADIQSEIDTLQAYKKSVITEAVTKGLDKNAEMKDSGVEYIGLVPSNWRLVRLKYVLSERNYRSETGKETLLSVSQYLGVVPSDTIQRTMQANSLIGYKKVFENDLVFNKLNPVLARFGVSSYEGITSPDFSVYYTNSASTKFLCYLLRTDLYVTEYGRICTGVGDGFSRLYTPMLYNIKVALPAIDEQMIIVDYLEKQCCEIDSIISQKKEQLGVLADYKKSVIYEYVTGKKEVPAV